MTYGSAFVFCPPCPIDFDVRLDALWDLASLPVVSADFFKILITVFGYIILGALLAFVEMTVSHPRVFVELCQWLDGFALETFLL